MTHNLISFLTRGAEKLSEIAQYPFTWISGLALFIVDALVGGKLIIYVVLIASIVDLGCGIAVALSRKRFTQSELMRLTVEKLLVYFSVLLVFLCIDQVIERETGFETDITAGLVGVLMTLVESVSFTASLLILFPRNAFLRMFQRMLKGEIARKLDCTEEEVDALLALSRKKKSIPRGKNGQFISKKK